MLHATRYAPKGLACRGLPGPTEVLLIFVAQLGQRQAVGGEHTDHATVLVPQPCPSHRTANLFNPTWFSNIHVICRRGEPKLPARDLLPEGGLFIPLWRPPGGTGGLDKGIKNLFRTQNPRAKNRSETDFLTHRGDTTSAGKSFTPLFLRGSRRREFPAKKFFVCQWTCQWTCQWAASGGLFLVFWPRPTHFPLRRKKFAPTPLANAMPAAGEIEAIDSMHHPP